MLRQIFSDFLHAVQFLTRLPVHRWMHYDSTAVLRSCRYFPAAGALVGLLTALVFSALHAHLPTSIAVVGAIIAQVVITGAMHEDGLADAADGLCGYATRERAMEIMRDSRIGSYGAAALSLSLLARFAIYQELAKSADLTMPLIAACLLSRACAVMIMSTTPNARTESATSIPYSGGLPRSERPLFLISTLLVALILLHRHPLPIVAAALATAALRVFFLKRIGGHTGDCLGATIVITELSALAALLFQ